MRQRVELFRLLNSLEPNWTMTMSALKDLITSKSCWTVLVTVRPPIPCHLITAKFVRWKSTLNCWGETNTNWRKRRIKESPWTRTRGRAIKYVLQRHKRKRKGGTRLKIPSSKTCENSEFQWMNKLWWCAAEKGVSAMLSALIYVWHWKC